MDQIGKKLWDWYTDYLSLTPIHPQYFVKKYENTAIEWASQYASGVLLDIGCGRMPYKKILLSRVKKYIALDSPKTSKFYYREEKPDIFADAISIPLPDHSCDTILLLQVLEHLPEPEKVLKEIYRLLKSHGILILSTVQTYPLHDEPFDYYRFTKEGLYHLLQKNGFKILKHKQEGNLFVLIFQSINFYLMSQLKILLKKKVGKIVAILLLPLILTITTLINFLTFPFLMIDRKSDFSIVQSLVARKIKYIFSE